jgi:two-component system chemotaxis sensor kinase CheA
VRVSTERLDALLHVVGELIRAHDAPEAAPRTDETDRTVGLLHELQHLVMGLRMVTLRPTFEKIDRLVRQLARKTGKAVRLVTEGAETEIDRTVTEALADPLVHLIRNAVDHGIEPPDARRQAGKPVQGTVRLAARHEAGHAVIEVADDGRGLDGEGIARQAAQDGLLAPHSSLTDAAALDLLCRPGFSTAAEVTDLSGRGVGLDLVRQRVDALQGQLDATSEAGRGTTFTLRLPLTMALTDAVLVRVGEQRYAIPIPEIERIFRPEPNAVVRTAARGQAISLDGELVPVFHLHHLLDAAADDAPAGGLMLVASAEGRRLGLLADEFLGQQRIVTKPLGKGIGRVPGIAGGTVLADGRVALVLDPPSLRRVARQHRTPTEKQVPQHPAGERP